MKNARLLALPILTAGIIGGAALSLGGTAIASAQGPTGPGYSYGPSVKAKPAPSQQPGWRNHHGPNREVHLNNR